MHEHMFSGREVRDVVKGAETSVRRPTGAVGGLGGGSQCVMEITGYGRSQMCQMPGRVGDGAG